MAMLKTLVFLEEFSMKLDKKLDALNIDKGDVIFLTRNERCFLRLRDMSYNVHFLQDLLTPEDIDNTDTECLGFIRSMFFPVDDDIFRYKGIQMGRLIELYLIPHFIRIYRDILLMDKALAHFQYNRIVVSGPGDFTANARRALLRRGIPFESWFNSLYNRFPHMLMKLWRGKKNRWVGMLFRDFIFEPLQNFCVIADSYFWELLSYLKGKKVHGVSKNCLVFSADYHTYSVNKMLDSRKWASLAFGIDYLYRKKILKGVRSIEAHFKWSSAIKTIATFVHFLSLWMRLSRDAGFKRKFEFKGVNYWGRVKDIIKYNMLISFPRLFLTHLIAVEAFNKNRCSVLILPAEEPPYYRTLINAAVECNVKSMVIQHGVLVKPNGHNRIGTDFYAGWGKRAIEWFSKFNDKNTVEKIHITGVPRYDEYATQKDLDRNRILDTLGLPENKIIVLVLTEWAQDLSVSSTDMEDILMLDAVISALLSLGLKDKVHVVLKPHPTGDIDVLREFLELKRSGFQNVSVITNRLKDLLFAADLCVSSYSTTVLEAMFFGKPAIVFDHYTKKEFVPYASMGVALSASDEVEMASAIKSILYDGTVVEGIHEAQKEFIEYAAYKIDGRSTERLLKFIAMIAEGESPQKYIALNNEKQ